MTKVKIQSRTKKKGKPLRPTTGKAREAFFNILRGKIDNARVLDLYAGTGAVGLEALKKGASEIIFVEVSSVYTKKINELIRKLGFAERARVITKKALPFIKWLETELSTFDIIFLDPPYHTNEIINVLSAIGKSHILKQKGIVIAEHFKKRQLPEKFGSLQKGKDYIYGDTVLSLYKASKDACVISPDSSGQEVNSE